MMTRYINAEKIISHLNDEIEGCGDPDVYSQPVAYGTYLGLTYARSVVETAETADVVQVVRCKDCQYFERKDLMCERCGDIEEPCGGCHYTGGCTYDDGYCHHGERRKSNADGT